MKVAIAGAGGRMGQALIEAVLADRELALTLALDVVGAGKGGGGTKITSDPTGER